MMKNNRTMSQSFPGIVAMLQCGKSFVAKVPSYASSPSSDCVVDARTDPRTGVTEVRRTDAD